MDRGYERHCLLRMVCDDLLILRPKTLASRFSFLKKLVVRGQLVQREYKDTRIEPKPSPNLELSFPDHS